MKLKIKYLSKEIDKLKFIDGKSDWIDLRSAERLGVAIELPKGYEALVVPRSSTFKNFGILQTNSIGVIDESYCGDNDEWKYPALAMRDTVINIHDRICQFRIIKHQDFFEFEEVDKLNGVDRGGFGSTGKN